MSRFQWNRIRCINERRGGPSNNNDTARLIIEELRRRRVKKIIERRRRRYLLFHNKRFQSDVIEKTEDRRNNRRTKFRLKRVRRPYICRRCLYDSLRNSDNDLNENNGGSLLEENQRNLLTSNENNLSENMNLSSSDESDIESIASTFDVRFGGNSSLSNHVNNEVNMSSSSSNDSGSIMSPPRTPPYDSFSINPEIIKNIVNKLKAPRKCAVVPSSCRCNGDPTSRNLFPKNESSEGDDEKYQYESDYPSYFTDGPMPYTPFLGMLKAKLAYNERKKERSFFKGWKNNLRTEKGENVKIKSGGWNTDDEVDAESFIAKNAKVCCIIFLGNIHVEEWNFGIFLENKLLENFSLYACENQILFKTFDSRTMDEFTLLMNDCEGKIKLPFIDEVLSFKKTEVQTLTLTENNLLKERRRKSSTSSSD